jgi:hypothetical protein
MSSGARGKFSILRGSKHAIRRLTSQTPSGTVRPSSGKKGFCAGTQGPATGIVIDLQPDSTEEVAYSPNQRKVERADENAKARRAEPDAPQDGIEWTYQANPDTPFRKRTHNQKYEAAEGLDASSTHRGGKYDLKT